MTIKRIPLEQRFWEKVEVRGDQECWLWKGRLHCGYGRIGEGGHRAYSIRAHRVSWDIAHPNDLVKSDECICHSCDNPQCVNPNHLWKGTKADNNHDMAIKGRARGHGVYGSGNGRAILTEKDIPVIFELRRQGLIYKEISAKFGVAWQTIGKVLRGESWRATT